MVSFLASFVLSFFPLDVLDEIWDVTESVSEGFLTYSLMAMYKGVHPPPRRLGVRFRAGDMRFLGVRDTR